jgi:thiol-disulfide isomerase/thioredoxin
VTSRIRIFALAGTAIVALALVGRAALDRYTPPRFTLPDSGESTGPGDPCPEISLPDAGGRLHALCGESGEYTLINFWTSWCAPCMAEFDELVATLREYEPKGVRFVSVSLDSAENYEYVVRRLPAGHPALNASVTGENVSSRFGNVRTRVPFDVLVAPDGTIQTTRHGSFGGAEAIRAWLDGELARPARQASAAP